MVCSECSMVPVGIMRDRTVPAGWPAHLQRSQWWATGFGRIGRRRGYIRFRSNDARRPDAQETQVSENQQAIAPGIIMYIILFSVSI